MKAVKVSIVLLVCYFSLNTANAQEIYSLQSCLEYALENNHNLKKSHLDREKSMQARKEIMGNLLPQINGTGNINYNLKKTKFIMPNFINEMLPPASRDPNAAKYMTIEMGTNYSAGLGASLNQQILNFSLFNAVEISKIAENLAELGIESTEEDIIAQTANIYYSIQSTKYAVTQFDQSIVLLDKMLETMESSYESGLIKKIDLDRVKINKVNMLTQQSAIANAARIQMNLLKLQMGFEMNEELLIEDIDLTVFESKAGLEPSFTFETDRLIPSLIFEEQQRIGQLQVKSVKYESLPTLSFGLNYQHNFVSDEFFRGPANYNYPSSMVGLNLRVPIFGGLTRHAKLKGANIEMKKIQEDAMILDQSLTMAYSNAMLKLEDSKRTIDAQQGNMDLAEEVFKISEASFIQGLASLSDVLNANSSLIQSQVSYADALNNFMKGYIELRQANGTIRELIKK